MKNFYYKYLKYKKKYYNLKKISGGSNKIDKVKDYQIKIDENYISNSNILLFIIKFICYKKNLQNIIINNYEYINSISNFNFKFESLKFKKLFDNLLQWILFEYDKKFFNMIINILINIFSNFNFNENHNISDNNLSILIFGIIDEIDLLKNQKNKDNNTKNNIILLQILLRIIVFKYLDVFYFISNFLLKFKEKENIVLSKEIIICLLEKIKLFEVSKNIKIREIITKIILNTNEYTNYKNPNFYFNLIEILIQVFSIFECSYLIGYNIVKKKKNYFPTLW